jgi:hypothetical protein
MHFVDAQGNPVPLHPGRTWIHIITPFSSVTQAESPAERDGAEGTHGKWLVQFVQQYDPEDTPTP